MDHWSKPPLCGHFNMCLFVTWEQPLRLLLDLNVEHTSFKWILLVKRLHTVVYLKCNTVQCVFKHLITILKTSTRRFQGDTTASINTSITGKKSPLKDHMLCISLLLGLYMSCQYSSLVATFMIPHRVLQTLCQIGLTILTLWKNWQKIKELKF